MVCIEHNLLDNSVLVSYKNCTLLSLPLGYVYCAKDKRHYAIQCCDLQLYQFPDDSPPKNYAFSVVAGNYFFT